MSISLRHLGSRLWIRLLAFNVLLVFVPAAGFLFLGVYERQLLAAQERSMVQQGRILAAALSDNGALSADTAVAMLERLERRVTARLRILDADGKLLADSSRLGPRSEGAVSELDPGVRGNWLYRLGAGLVRTVETIVSRPGPGSGIEYYDKDDRFDGPEVRAALAGRYGAETRLSGGQRSVTLYSAIPVRNEGRVVGAVLVSQSTLRLLQDLYDLRLAGAKVFVASLLVAALLSLVVSTTIVRPVARLRREAHQAVDRRGRLRGGFGGSKRADEIGDLARALEELSSRLQHHLRFIESFAADVSHEFKNPLAGIRTATEMALEVEERDQQLRLGGMVLEQVARMERLLSAVREITLIDAQLEEESRVPIELREVLESLLEVAGLRRPSLTFELTGAAEATVEASPQRLEQVLVNLLENAASFSTEGGLVRVELAAEPERVVVSVEDDGPGVAPEDRERIFERFFTHRPHQGERSDSDHSGLGLAIVKAIVEGYGGSVGVEESPRGGRFVVSFPSTSRRAGEVD